MGPHQDSVLPDDIAHHQSEVLPAVEGPVSHCPELTERGGELSLCHPLHESLVTPAVGDEVGDGPDEDVVLFGEELDIAQPCHGPIVIDHLCQHRGWVSTRHGRQVHRGLGVPGAAQYPARLVPEREDMARTVEVVVAGLRVDGRPDGSNPVGRRDPGGGPLAGIDRDGECGAADIGVDRHHHRQPELVEALAQHGQADDPRGVADHEPELLLGDCVGGDDQVAFVLSVGIIDHDHQFAAGDGLDELFDRCEAHMAASGRCSRFWLVGVPFSDSLLGPMAGSAGGEG